MSKGTRISRRTVLEIFEILKSIIYKYEMKLTRCVLSSGPQRFIANNS